MNNDFENLDPDHWDQEFADELVGQTLLVGLTFLDQDGDLRETKQIFGVVESCDESAGIAIRPTNGSPIEIIAPVLDAIDYGDPGVYQLSSDDPEVTDPDFTALITVKSPIKN